MSLMDTQQAGIVIYNGMHKQFRMYWSHVTCFLFHIDGLVQERRNSSALAMELRLSCTKPSI